MNLVAALRRALGTDQLAEMVIIMASAAQQINDLNDRVNDLIADVKASNDILNTKAGQLDEEGQAALDKLSASVANFDAEVGDADGSDVTATPQQPTAFGDDAPQ